jgi:uncharacterized protein YeaO (DUF488 family)
MKTLALAFLVLVANTADASQPSDAEIRAQYERLKLEMKTFKATYAKELKAMHIEKLRQELSKAEAK